MKSEKTSIYTKITNRYLIQYNFNFNIPIFLCEKYRYKKHTKKKYKDHKELD